LRPRVSAVTLGRHGDSEDCVSSSVSAARVLRRSRLLERRGGLDGPECRRSRGMEPMGRRLRRSCLRPPRDLQRSPGSCLHRDGLGRRRPSFLRCCGCLLPVESSCSRRLHSPLSLGLLNDLRPSLSSHEGPPLRVALSVIARRERPLPNQPLNPSGASAVLPALAAGPLRRPQLAAASPQPPSSAVAVCARGLAPVR